MDQQLLTLNNTTAEVSQLAKAIREIKAQKQTAPSTAGPSTRATQLPTWLKTEENLQRMVENKIE